MVLDDSVGSRGQAVEEMLRLARAIVADDEVSDHEAKMFRAWLERHPDVADADRVREMHSILENVLEEGKLSEDERRALRELLEGVGRKG